MDAQQLQESKAGGGMTSRREVAESRQGAHAHTRARRTTHAHARARARTVFDRHAFRRVGRHEAREKSGTFFAHVHPVDVGKLATGDQP